MSSNSRLFEDAEGTICAVVSTIPFNEAKKIACDKLMCEDVSFCSDYSHMYFGFGNSDGEVKNNWWLVDSSSKNAIPVWAFREKF